MDRFRIAALLVDARLMLAKLRDMSRSAIDVGRQSAARGNARGSGKYGERANRYAEAARIIEDLIEFVERIPADGCQCCREQNTDGLGCADGCGCNWLMGARPERIE